MAGRRRREGVTLTISAILADVATFEKEVDPSVAEDGSASIDHEVQYTYVAPSGRRMGVTKEQMQGKEDGWPLPGIYEVDIVNSNGDSILPAGPWKAEHLDRDSLMKADEKEGNPAVQLFTAMGEEARITIRNQRADINAAQARERAARDDLNTQIDVAAKLQKEKNAAIAIAERAEAEKELAEERQKVAEEALAQLQNEIAYMKPQIAEAVDHFISQTGKLLGVQDPTNDVRPATQDAEQSANPSHAPDGSPAPPGAEEPRVVLNDLLERVIFNADVCEELVNQGVLSWETVRAIVWIQTGQDPGPEPVWPPAEEEPVADAEPQRGVA